MYEVTLSLEFFVKPDRVNMSMTSLSLRVKHSVLLLSTEACLKVNYYSVLLVVMLLF